MQSNCTIGMNKEKRRKGADHTEASMIHTKTNHRQRMTISFREHASYSNIEGSSLLKIHDAYILFKIIIESFENTETFLSTKLLLKTLARRECTNPSRLRLTGSEEPEFLTLFILALLYSGTSG